MTLPQVRGMFGGDFARKKNLIDYGFRLPSAYDNRPLNFDEFYDRVNQVVFVSATPGDFERGHSTETVEQVIRPTGLDVYKRQSYLRIIAHHLIVDGVSWRILLDDLAMLLRQARDQNPLRLPEKGLSYQQYAENLLKKQQGFAASSALWEEIRVLNGARLLMVPDTACTYGEAGILLTDFEPYITPELLAKGSGRYQGNTGEFLLASLFRAVQTVFNTKEALFELEGHGRDRPGISLSLIHI